MSQSLAIEPSSQIAPAKAYPDWIGVAASLLCAIHCAAMPFVVGFLPLLGLSFLADPSFHQWMVAVCLALALVAFVPGWRRHHRVTPAIIGVLGLGMISFAAFAGPEDCCATGCGDSATPADSNGIAMVSNEDPTCADTCCADEALTAATLTAGGPIPTAEGEEAGCEASCCSTTNNDTVATVADAPDEAEPACEATCCADTEPDALMFAGEDPADGAACADACCLEDGGEDDTIMTAGNGDSMELFWLLLTPIGGFILVIAHLTNHRLGCRCNSEGCCSASRKAQPTA